MRFHQFFFRISGENSEVFFFTFYVRFSRNSINEYCHRINRCTIMEQNEEKKKRISRIKAVLERTLYKWVHEEKFILMICKLKKKIYSMLKVTHFIRWHMNKNVSGNSSPEIFDIFHIVYIRDEKNNERRIILNCQIWKLEYKSFHPRHVPDSI